ncbi:GTPase activating protein Gyp7 [Pilobolus umbonatus]|nr:GTPase activating protein Gyp7 [Pilobolus umbonatus]
MDDTENFSIISDPRMEANATLSVGHQEVAVKLLYSKSKVYVHPSTQAKDFIPGFLSIVENTSHDYLLAWTPESLIPSKDMEAFVQVDVNDDDAGDIHSSVMIPSIPDESKLYALSAPVNTIHSLVIKAPSFSKWYGTIIINFMDGHSSTPLWFHDDESMSTVLQKNTQGGKYTSQGGQVRWGGDEFIERLSQIIPVEKSTQEENLYILNKPPSTANQRQANVFDSTQMDPFIATLKEARWNILEKLARVTKFSKDAAINLLNSPASRPIVPLLPPGVQELCYNETVKKTIDDYDSARIYLAKWAAGLAAQSESNSSSDRKYRNVGVWGHEGWEEETALGVFEILNSESDFSIPTHTRTGCVSSAEWKSFFDHEGRLSVGQPVIRKKIFCGGLDPSIRKEAWLFLLGVYPWDSTAHERYAIEIDRKESYETLKNTWHNDADHRSTSDFQDQKHRIDKDVHRTDRTIDIYVDESMPNPDPVMNVGTNENLETLKHILCTYNVFNTDLGYVQGMSDLLSPLFAIIEDEAMAFWAFSGYMNRMKYNFYRDQSGMHRQLLTLDLLLQFMDPSLYKHFQRTDSTNLFFCFRWLLVWFKREFPWKDMLSLWEILWTDYLTDKFYLFVAMSILDQHRDILIDYLKNFDEILKYINDLSMTIPLNETLQRAEILFYQFKQRVEAVDNKREQLKHNIKAGSGTKEEMEDMKADLSKLPVINELLRELLSSSYSDGSNEKQ